MILLVWASEKAKDVAAAIEEKFKHKVQVFSGLDRACGVLRAGGCSAVLVDQWISEAEPTRSNVLFDCIGDALLLFVNFGISNQGRVLRELEAALHRRERETVLFRRLAKVALRDEFKDDVTVLLLTCGVAMRDADLPGPLNARLQQINQVANQMKVRLAASEEAAV
jgi:hypothetical protein